MRGRMRGLARSDTPIDYDAPDLESATAEEVLAYAMERFHPRLTMACSFQKEESVLLHMLTAIEPRARTCSRSTPASCSRRRCDVEALRGPLRRRRSTCSTPAAPTSRGPSSAAAARPRSTALERALTGVDAWITGIRREQAPTRAERAEARARRAPRDLEVQPAGRLGREGRVALHLQARPPLQPAARQGYASIGCAPCTQPGEAARAGGPARTRPSAASTW